MDSETPDANAGMAAAPTDDGICTSLSALPPDALVTEKALAAMLGRSVVSIKRAVGRGELPPPVRILGCPRWTAGSIVRHIEKCLDSAARKAERKRRESEGESP